MVTREDQRIIFKLTVILMLIGAALTIAYKVLDNVLNVELDNDYSFGKGAIMSNEIEDYAKKYRKLHHKVVEAMAPFFKEYNWSPARAKIRIISPFWGTLSGRGSATAVFVVRRTIYVMRGALNVEGRIRGNYWDLASKAGFATFAHEVFHTYQSDRDSIVKFLGSLFSGIWKSLTRSKMIYDHQFFDFEQEAIDFQRKIKATLNLEDIKHFADMR